MCELAIITPIFPTKKAPGTGSFVKSQLDVLITHYKVNLIHTQDRILWSRTTLQNILKIMQSRKVIIHYPLLNIVLLAFSLLLFKQIIIFFHGSDVRIYPHEKVHIRFLKKFVRFIVTKTRHKIVVPSKNFRNTVRLPNSYVLAPDYCDTRIDLKVCQSITRVHLMGRERREKGKDNLVRIANFLSKVGYSVTTEFQTDGAHSIGNLAKSDYLQVLKNVDVTISLSEYESFGLSVVESITLGTPALVPRLEVFRDILGEDYPYFHDGRADQILALLKELDQSVSVDYATRPLLPTREQYEAKLLEIIN